MVVVPVGFCPLTRYWQNNPLPCQVFRLPVDPQISPYALQSCDFVNCLMEVRRNVLSMCFTKRTAHYTVSDRLKILQEIKQYI